MRRLPAILLVLLGACLGACASRGWTAAPSGFLTNYDQLEKAPGERGVLRYEKPGALAGYPRFLIEPIGVQARPGADLERVQQEELDALAADFGAALREQLAERYELVDAPGPRVLRLRAAITNVVPATPALNLHPATKLTGAGLGGASFEAEGVDSETGERIFAVMVSRGAAKRFGSGLSAWSDARQVMREWAAQFRARIDASRDGEPPPGAEQAPRPGAVPSARE